MIESFRKKNRSSLEEIYYVFLGIGDFGLSRGIQTNCAVASLSSAGEAVVVVSRLAGKARHGTVCFEVSHTAKTKLSVGNRWETNTGAGRKISKTKIFF